MKILFRAVTWLVLACMLSSYSIRAAVPSAQVDPRVLADSANGQKADFLVVLRSQADLAARTAKTRSAADGAAPGEEAYFRMLIAREVYSGLRYEADRSQPAVLAELKALGVTAQPFWIANLIAVNGDRTAVDAMASRPDVLEIESNRAFRVPLPEADPSPGVEALPAAVQGIEWNLSQIHAPEVWALGYTGQGIRIGIADTGMEWDHPALKGHYLGWNGTTADHNFAWWDGIKTQIVGGTTCSGYNLQIPCDDNGHGTHTTGTIIGSDGGSNQIGVAPGAKWMGCRNMDHNVGRPSTYIACLQFFMAPTDLQGNNPDPSRHADVVSNSYTCPPSELCTPRALQQAVEAMRAAGIFMSVAAGNEGGGCSSIVDPPAIEPSAITVGATDVNHQIAAFSSRGPVNLNGSTWRKPNLVAPGVNVRSSMTSGAYGTLSGTSMATPHVAGAVALLWSTVPSLRGDVDATQALFEDTAQHITTTEGCGGDTASSVPNNVYGYGLINVRAAIFKILFPLSFYIPLVAR